MSSTRFFAFFASFIFLLTAGAVFAGNTWTGGGASTSWSDNNNWGGAAPGYGTLTFTTGGTQGTTSSDNSITSMNQLLWTGSAAWTLNQGGATVLSLFDNGGGQAKVENQSSSLVTINLPITFAANNGTPPNPFGEINAVNANLTFASGTLTVNGSSVNGIKLFGGSRVVNFNNTVSATGKWFGITTGGTGNTINIGGSFTCSDFYMMNDGTLNLNSGGTLSASVRLGGDFGNTGAQVLTKSGTFNLAVTSGGQTFSGTINSVSGNTSGTLAVNSQNTSGSNTLSGHIALDSALKITQAAGGTLGITQVKGGDNSTATDIKGNTLTFTPASTASIFHNGTIYSSTNSSTANISMNGAGTLTLGGSSDNTNAQANVSAGTLVLNKTSSSTVHALGGNTNTVSGGTLQLTGTGGDQILNTSLLAVNSGTLDLNGQSETVAMLDGAGGILTNGSASTDSTLTLNIGGSAADSYTGKVATATSGGKINLVLNSVGTGTASLYSLNNSNNTFKGSIQVVGIGTTLGTNAVLGINGDACLGDVGNTLTLTNGGGLANMFSPTTAGSWPSHNAFTLDAGRSIILAGTAGGVVRLGYGDTCTINSTISGTGAFTKTDSGNLILGAANTFSGNTTIGTSGTLTLGNSLALQNSTVNYTTSGGALSLGSLTAVTLGGLQGNQALALTNVSGAAVALTVGNNNGSATNFTAGLSGPGGLLKVGSGVSTLAGTSTYTGNTTISAGTLALTGSASIANTTNISIASGATFDVSGLSSAFGLGSSQILIARGATATSKGSFNMNSGALVLTNAPGTATLTELNGTFTMSSGGSFTVSIANGGTLLSVGSYKLISKGAGGSVAGTVPTPIIQGDGLTTGAAATLQISGGELFLVVGCNGTLAVGISSQSNVSCNGGNNGSVTVSGSAGSGTGYTYAINGGSFGGSATFSGLSAGSNYVTVMDSLGCTASTPVIITQPSPVSLSLTPTNPSGCGGSNGAVQATFSGGTGAYQVKIDGGSFSAQSSPFTFTGLSAGVHTVVLQDANGCSTNASSTLSDPSGSTLSLAQTSTTCNGGSDGAVTATFSGSSPFQLALDGGSFVTQTSPFTFTGLTAGSHAVILKDNNGCTTSISTNVAQPAVVAFTTSSTNVTCNGSANGSIAILASGGNGGYVYSINNGATYSANSLITGLSGATYQVAVKDTNGCFSVTNAVTITEPSALSCSITPSSATICTNSTQGFTVNPIGGTTNYTYAWSGPGGFTAATASITVGVPGTYTNTVTDANGCTTTCTATLTVNATSVGGAATPAASNVCTNSGTSITLAGNVGTIQWQSRTGTNAFADISGETNATVNTGNLSSSTDYRAVVTSGVCSTSFSTTNTITVNPVSVGGTASASSSSLCGSGITTISLTNYTGSIQWQSSTDNITFGNVSGGSGATSATYTTATLTTTTYFQAVVTSGACSSSTSTAASVTVNSAPGITGQPLSLTNCSATSASLSVTANGTSPSFNWRKRGTGWGNGWTFNAGAGGGFFLGDSANNGAGGTGTINTGGKAWGFFNTSGATVTEAIRSFPSAVQVGQQFQIDIDTGFITTSNGVGISLRNASSNVVWEFYFIGGTGNGWKINDNSGANNIGGSGLGFTADGLRLILTLTGPTNYSATVLTKPILGGGTLYGPFTGALKNPAGGAGIAQLRMWDNNGAGGGDHDAFFNSVIVNGTADDNANNYSAWPTNSDKGNRPLVDGGNISGSTSSTLTINPAGTGDAGSYDVVVQNSCGITNSAAATLTVNAAPVAGTASYTRGNNISLKISVSDLLTNASSASGNPSFVSVSSSTNGANVSVANGYVLYTNSVTPNVNDSFTYTVMDTNSGCTTSGTVLITVVGGQIGQTNATVIVSSTNASVTFFGVPSSSYVVQRSTNLSPGVGLGWVSISTNTAPSNGLFLITDDFHDLGISVPPIPSPAFYRLMTP